MNKKLVNLEQHVIKKKNEIIGIFMVTCKWVFNFNPKTVLKWKYYDKCKHILNISYNPVFCLEIEHEFMIPLYNEFNSIFAYF